MSRRGSAVRRRGRALAVLALACALLAGCVSLPRSGPVTASEPDLPAQQGIGLYAQGPQEGANPREIVEGFLTASAAGYSDEFLVAREFMAGPAVETWQPLEQVRIYSDTDTPEFTRTADGAVRLTVAGQASIDSAGHYTESVPETTVEADFTLARNPEGEWRIIELDDGVLLSAAFFDSLYAPSPLYFLTPDLTAVVPDLRWFPRQNQATALVRSLLEGPSAWLAPGVVTLVPAGTRMVVESVLVQDGVARVDLSADALAADPSQRALLLAQVELTLRGVPGVQEVELTAAGAPYEVPESEPELPAYPYTAAPLVGVADGVLVDVVGGEAVPRPGSDRMAGADPRHPAVGYATAAPPTVYLDGPDRLTTAPTAEEPGVVLAQGQALVPPSVDRRDWVWTGPTRATGTLLAVHVGGEAADVDASWLNGATVRALRVSREGARAVVVWEQAGAVQVDVAVVVRSRDGTPTALVEPVRLGERLTDATDVAWVDEQTVAVLGTSGNDTSPAVHLLPVGGPTRRLPSVDGATSLTAGRGDRSVVLGTESGRLYERNGASWRPVEAGVRYPALPG
ncbi:LpqB family beta-propeller domain-containing protein [Georgenia sp. TF02-10]|uniref:LpqB family beta-propeller domain-containing protein n=1 Tax=Georgenia sp. TF02-10 TaxID=2917725 RepID=UPI001FA6E1B7|nr:LpqB family beta-propeller domain-containing protein [Georgenia sp. TF02-10]UNX55815.1 LpqB family beta-propeller domain-containing protein [Georgenia sp. TF02-10]